tara:strand:- start:130 stop:591 length:462 start_codon:yes stop_codon:yes gene_type:complete
MKIPFWRWWLFMCFLITAMATAVHLNVHQMFLENDNTFISVGIFSLFCITSLFVGWRTYKLSYKEEYMDTKILWYITELLVTLGLIGTVIGFIIMTVGTFQNLDITDIEEIKNSLTFIAGGMGTALFTTLSGFICSVLLSIQLLNLDNGMESW